MLSKHLLVVFMLAALATPGAARDLTVAAGESFRPVFTDLAAQYEQQSGVKVTLHFAASSALAKQVGDGGIDIIACALSWADRLDKDGKLESASRATFLSDHLILIAPAASIVTWTPGAPLAPLLGKGNLAIADPDSSQTGQYSRSALTNLGLWDGVQAHLLKTANIREALAAVASGNAALGLVYQTDLQNQASVHVAGRLPDDSHPPIAYSFALTRGAEPDAKALLTFLESDAAHAAYARAGFEVHP